jgi:hypothetical protein
VGGLLLGSQLPSNLYFNRQSGFGRRVSDKVIPVNLIGLSEQGSTLAPGYGTEAFKLTST